MALRCRPLLLALLLFTCTMPTAAAQTAPAAAPGRLTAEQMEAFLRTARVIARRPAKKGVTDTVVATLTDGQLTHDAQIQTVDIAKSIFQSGRASETNFKDSYKFNIAGYRLARTLGLQTVPVSVERRLDGKMAAVTWWIDGPVMDEDARLALKTPAASSERVAKQMHVMRAWDELIQNRDRNKGNLLWTPAFALWLIDHTRAFRLDDTLREPAELLRADRDFLAALRRLTKEDMDGVARGGILTRGEAAAVLKRRDRLVKHFEDLVAVRGEAAVLFSDGMPAPD